MRALLILLIGFGFGYGVREIKSIRRRALARERARRDSEKAALRKQQDLLKMFIGSPSISE